MNNIGKPRRVALFVGVDKYEDTNIPPLNGAVADATSLHSFFAARPGQFDKTAALFNPSSDEVFRQVRDLTTDLGEGDFFMFYFAGHGMDDGGKQKLLCTNTLLGQECLTNEFDLRNVAAKAKWNVAVLLDACRSSLDANRALEQRVGNKRDIDFYDALVAKRDPNEASLAILFSCDEGKTAGEVPGKNHGLFSLALLDVLERAEREHRGWCFDQNLGDEIGNTMRRIATTDSGQRPWIKASGKAPLFFLPTLDFQPMKDWVHEMNKKGFLSDNDAAECQKVLGGTSRSPCAKGIFEAIHFFSNWENVRNEQAAPQKTASDVLKALCAEMLPTAPYSIPVYEAKPNVEKTDEVRPLSIQELRRLRGTFDGINGNWRKIDSMRQALAKMVSAQTDVDAIAAIHEVETAIRDAFIGKNCTMSSVGGDYSTRLEPMFSAMTWNTLRHELFYLRDPSNVDQALCTLFKVAGACCKIMRG